MLISIKGEHIMCCDLCEEAVGEYGWPEQGTGRILYLCNICYRRILRLKRVGA
jgi:hypothetical protein